jgi:hypothetical protein
MFNIIKKDLPLKSLITTFECKLDKPEMDKKIKRIIDEYGDRQNHKTNVKAQMTEWKMWDEPGFNELVPIVLDISKQISQTKFKNRKINSKLDSMWGVKYKSEEITIAHDHWPAVWSFVYYLNAPKNAPGLFFTEMGEHGGEIKIEPGLLIFFEGHITHEVKSKKFEGHRYVVSGNIYD